MASLLINTYLINAFQSIIVKETRIGDNRKTDARGVRRNGLPHQIDTEAAILEQLNTRACNNVIQLRAFRRALNPISPALLTGIACYRQYLEFCDQGDLWDLYLLHRIAADGWRQRLNAGEQRSVDPARPTAL